MIIDTHFHAFPEKYLELVPDAQNDVRGVGFRAFDHQEYLDVMDKHGIDVGVLSNTGGRIEKEEIGPRPWSCARSSTTRLPRRMPNTRKILDAAYDEEIKVMERRLEFKPEAFQAILDETAKVDARAKKIKPQDVVDRRFLDALEKNGFFDKLWAGT